MKIGFMAMGNYDLQRDQATLRGGETRLVGVANLDEACAALEAPPPGRRSVPGSVPWVPPAAGLIIASEVIKDLIGGAEI